MYCHPSSFTLEGHFWFWANWWTLQQFLSQWGNLTRSIQRLLEALPWARSESSEENGHVKNTCNPGVVNAVMCNLGVEWGDDLHWGRRKSYQEGEGKVQQHNLERRRDVHRIGKGIPEVQAEEAELRVVREGGRAAQCSTQVEPCIPFRKLVGLSESLVLNHSYNYHILCHIWPFYG